MKKEDKIVLPTDPEAAIHKTNITGWVSRNGLYFGSDEDRARKDGATHIKCNCGELHEKFTYCRSCNAKRSKERYLSLPYKEYNDEPTFLYGDDTFFFSEEDLYYYCEDNDFEDGEEINLVFCDECYYRKVEYDYWEDDIVEDGELPKELEEALKNLNKVIERLPVASYVPGKVRTTYIYKKED